MSVAQRVVCRRVLEATRSQPLMGTQSRISSKKAPLFHALDSESALTCQSAQRPAARALVANEFR
jgi:hypothetical protein